MEIPQTPWSQALWRGGGGRTAASPGQVLAGPSSGRDWEAAFPPSLVRTGRGLGRGSFPARLTALHAPPLPSRFTPRVWASAFSTSLRVHRLDLSGTFLGNLFPGSFRLQKGRNWWEWIYCCQTGPSSQQACRPDQRSVRRETELCHTGGPGHHLATWGGSSAVGAPKAPPLPPRPS